MAHFDVFNGDADGICALHQLRLAEPLEATLVTGVKRDIALLERVDAQAGDTITVLDVSIDVNRKALIGLLERGVTIHYFDHHNPAEVPIHPGLHAFIDTTPDICTGIIVDRWLGGAQRIWAVVAAFGDNFAQRAAQLAQSLRLSGAQLDALQSLGEALNYNAYGDEVADLIIHPAALYTSLHRYADPFVFMEAEPLFQIMRNARANDLEMALRIPPYIALDYGQIIILPDAAWSRRVRGTAGNILATRAPRLACAILTPDRCGGYTVSVRAPFAIMHGADRLCHSFSDGGGRPAAAGINHLPADKLCEFVDMFKQIFKALL